MSDTTIEELISFFENKEIILGLFLAGNDCYRININISGYKTQVKVRQSNIEYYDQNKPDMMSDLFIGQENLIKILHFHLNRIYKQTSKLRTKIDDVLTDGPNRSDFIKRYYYIQERIEEFEVIRDYKVDLIRLNDLYDFYGKEFDYV